MNPVLSKRRKWTSHKNKIVMECYLLSEPKIRGYRKQRLGLWLQKGMFWVSEKRLVDQVNTTGRNSWMTELEIEELQDVRNVLPEEQADILDENLFVIVMEIVQVIKRCRRDS